MESTQLKGAVNDRVRIDNYRMLEKIGEGGYGLVYKAEQISTGQIVAIKMLKFPEGVDEQRRNYQAIRFERETKLCAELNHPNIVKLLDKGYSEEGEPYGVFEFVSGKTLKDAIGVKNGLSALETKELMGQVLDALASAHAIGIVHRDLKPHNIMVTQTGSKTHVKVLDFGIGAFTQEFRGNDYQSLTLTQEVMGTPAYCSPEQLRGDPPSVKSDLYAWGLILLECLTGEPVIEGDSIAEVFQQQLSSTNVPLPPGIAGHSLADLLRRTLDKNPRLRISDAKALYHEFTKVNFESIVGKIGRNLNGNSRSDAMTEANDLAWLGPRSEKRQITVLCVKLSLTASADSPLDLETLDAIQQDQLNLCRDMGVRFGGHIAGGVADNVVIYFGYPLVSDNDARRAGRTALELMGQVRKRSALLFGQHGIRLHARMGMHTGTVLSKPNHTPEGKVPNVAFNLLYNAQPGHILVSDVTRKLLDPFLEFEAANAFSKDNLSLPEQGYLITGERQTEALSFLRPWSANREMVGRETERQQVLQAWESAKSGQGKAISLQGQAGIGKSKMVYEIKKQVRSEGKVIRELRSLPELQNNALNPFLTMLRQHWGIADLQDHALVLRRLHEELQAAGCDVPAVMPILCSWLNISAGDHYPASALGPPEQKVILFDALRRCILAIGGGDPFLLVLEDLHWLDPTSTEFVGELLSDLSQQNYLLLMTARPAFENPWKQDVLLEIALEVLSQVHTDELVQAVLSGKSIGETALEYISERTDGIPLYIEELTRMLVDENYLEEVEGTYQLNESEDISEIPNTLQDLLNARLNRLGLAKESAQLAATIGREFDYALLVAASLRDEASVQSDLDALMHADLVYRLRKAQGESYIFRHALIRDAAYEGMVSSRVRENHLRVAETLEQHFEDRIEENPFEIARHFHGSGMNPKAISYGVKAAKDSVDRSADQEVLEYTRILDNWLGELPEGEGDHETVLNVHCMRTNALMNKFGWTAEEVQMAAHRAYELLKEHGWQQFDPNIIISTYWVLYLPDHVGSRRDKLEVLTKEMLEIAESAGNAELLLSANFLRGMHFFIIGDLANGIELMHEVVDHLDQYGNQKPSFTVGLENFCWAASCLGQAYWLNGDKQKGYHYTFLALERAIELDHPGTMFLMYHYAGLIYSWDHDKKNAQKFAMEAVAIGEKHNLQAYSIYAKAVYSWATNDVDGLASSIKILDDNGCYLGMPNWKAFQADHEISFGDRSKASALLDECLAFCARTNERYYEGEVRKMKELVSVK